MHLRKHPGRATFTCPSGRTPRQVPRKGAGTGVAGSAGGGEPTALIQHPRRLENNGPVIAGRSNKAADTPGNRAQASQHRPQRTAVTPLANALPR
jgi:hypothetical protein